MEPLVHLLMDRYGFSRPSAEAYAKKYMANFGGGSVPTYVADDVPRQVFNISNDARKAVIAADSNKDQIARGLIPGPRPQAPGIGPTPGVQAFNMGRDQVYREAQDPLTAEALKFWNYIPNAQEAWANTREVRDTARKNDTVKETTDTLRQSNAAKEKKY